jgi:hypothetical protein
MTVSKLLTSQRKGDVICPVIIRNVFTDLEKKFVLYDIYLDKQEFTGTDRTFKIMPQYTDPIRTNRCIIPAS